MPARDTVPPPPPRANTTQMQSQHTKNEAGTAGPPTASPQPPPDSAEHDGTAVDLARGNSPEPAGSVSPSPHRGSSSPPPGATGSSGQTLGSWLQPASTTSTTAAAAARGRGGTTGRRKRAVGGTESSVLAPRGTSAWASFSQRQADGGGRAGRGARGGDGSLAAWLEPRPAAADSGAKRRAPRDGALDAAVAGQRSSEQSTSDDEEDDGDGWMCARLEGLDPTGAARYRTATAPRRNA